MPSDQRPGRQPAPLQRDHPSGRFRHVFSAEPAAVRDALRRAVARFARQISVEDAGTLELTLAEALNNVVEHGYASREPGPVDLLVVKGRGNLECRIVDAGVPMPGLVSPSPGIQAPPRKIETMPEGGWGWALIRVLTTDLDYRRENGRNILTFRVPVAGKPAPSHPYHPLGKRLPIFLF